jgi:hypothetical protein
MTGLARPNSAEVWIDPFHYQRKLTEAVRIVKTAGCALSAAVSQASCAPRQDEWGLTPGSAPCQTTRDGQPCSEADGDWTEEDVSRPYPAQPQGRIPSRSGRRCRPGDCDGPRR